MSNLIFQLRKNKNNKGIMSSLKCAINPSKQHRAWPLFNKIGITINDKIGSMIAGLYALHPEESEQGDFGTTCLYIKKSRGEDNNSENITPIENRFQTLLSSNTSKEFFERIVRFVLLAKSNNIKINYIELEKSLRTWSEKTKIKWASSFWTPYVDTKELKDS